MIKSIIATLAVACVFDMMAPVCCNAEPQQNRTDLIFKPSLASRINRSYIKTPDGGRLPKQEEPVGVVTSTSPDGRTRQLAMGTIRCRLWKNCILFEEAVGEIHTWMCTFDDPGLGGGSKEIATTGGEKFNEFFRINSAESGKTLLVVTKAELTEDKMIVDPSDVIGLEDYHDKTLDFEDGDGGGGLRTRKKLLKGLPTGRKLAPTSGTLNTLVVRVIDSTGLGPTPLASSLSEDIFGDEYCLKSQFERCSYDFLKIQEYTPGGISNVPIAPNAPGVIEITTDIAAEGSSIFAMENSARSKLTDVLGGDAPDLGFDLVLFCMPPGTGDWIGYGYYNGWSTYYNDDWCGKMSLQMHEVGHNIGLDHSGDDNGFSTSSEEYGDNTDLMGYSFFEDDGPAMCFNPAKNWQLGWYLDRQIEIDPSLDLSIEPVSYTLNGVVDYDSGTHDGYIVIKIGSFYIGFNRATDFNVGVVEAANEVTVIEKLGLPFATAKSKLRAKLKVGDEYTMVPFDNIDVKVVYESNENGVDAVITLQKEGEGIGCNDGAEVTVEVTTDNYPLETSWEISFLNGTTYFSKSDYTNAATTEITTVTGLCRGIDYDFTMKDGFGDGMCCTYGEGSYALKYQGATLFSGGDFGAEAYHTFSLPLLLEPTASPAQSPSSSPSGSPSDCADETESFKVYWNGSFQSASCPAIVLYLDITKASIETTRKICSLPTKPLAEPVYTRCQILCGSVSLGPCA